MAPDKGGNGNNGIKTIALHREMEDSFMQFALSVIVGRALPDVRDDIKKGLHYDRKNDYIGEWVDSQKKTAEIEVKEK